MNKKRPNQITFRASDEEANRIRKKVKSSGMSQQEYLLSCSLNQQIVNTDGIKEVLPELKRIGNNLNQIARALNGTGYYPLEQVYENQKECETLWQSLRQYLPSQGLIRP